MRVCVVTPEYSSARPLGGIGTHLSALAPALARLGDDVHVIVPASISETMAGEVTVHPINRPELGRLFAAADPILAARAARKLRSLGAFDVIVAPEYGGLASHYARRKRSGPLVTNLQTSLEQALALTPPSTRWRGLALQQWLQRRAERRQAARSDAVLACSRALLEWSQRLWPLDGVPCDVLPNVIDIEQVRLAATRGSPELPEGGPVITFTGRLEPRKGADTLVRAMTRVWDEEPEARLALAGRDGLWGERQASEHLKELAGPRASMVTFLGALQPEALMPLLARSDLAAFPSRWEAFGLAALEALALGVPTIATAVGGFTDFMRDGENAILVSPDDPEALASALLGLLRDPQRRRALGAAGASAAEAFDADAQAGRYQRYLERVAGR